MVCYTILIPFFDGGKAVKNTLNGSALRMATVKKFDFKAKLYCE
jgi:hypothetical protein